MRKMLVLLNNYKQTWWVDLISQFIKHFSNLVLQSMSWHIHLFLSLLALSHFRSSFLPKVTGWASSSNIQHAPKFWYLNFSKRQVTPEIFLPLSFSTSADKRVTTAFFTEVVFFAENLFSKQHYTYLNST